MRHGGTTVAGRRVYLHIGEPKTGTTYLQSGLWANQRRLAARGVMLPGYNPRDHARASRDLREVPRQAGDASDPWAGEWALLSGQALRVPGRTVISSELLSACTPAQAERAVRSLLPANPHLVVTLRDFAGLLPAEWQETVKCGAIASWDEWLSAVVAAQPATDRRATSWFWRVHDTLAVLEMWSRLIPPDRVHVITVPRQPSPELLWARFAQVVGFDPAGSDLSRTRANSSLGLAETEYLRRLNQALPASLPDWFYTRELKQILAHGALSDRPQPSRLALTAAQRAWAAQQADVIVTGLLTAGYHIVGDLADLRPDIGSAHSPVDHGPVTAPAGQVSVPAEDQLEAAAQAAAALSVRCYRGVYPPPRSRSLRHPPAELARQLKWTVLHGPRIRRLLRRNTRRRAVRYVRVLIWSVLMHPGRSGRPGPAGAVTAGAVAGAVAAGAGRVSGTAPDRAGSDDVRDLVPAQRAAELAELADRASAGPDGPAVSDRG